jgi:uncharacterized membrane protein
MCKKGHQYDRYNIIAITPRYIFAFSHNASTLWRMLLLVIVIALGLLKSLSFLKVIALGSKETLLLFIVIAFST